MQAILILLMFVGCALGSPKLDDEIVEFLDLQAKILEIAKKHQPNPFLEGTSDLNQAVRTDINELKFESQESECLYRLGIACALSGGDGDAGDVSWYRIYDDVAWRCVPILAARPGWENAERLKKMHYIFGYDGGARLRFDEFLKRQSELTSEQAAGERP